MNRRVTVAAGVVLLGVGVFLGTLVPTTRAGEQEDMQAAMQKWAEYSTPGPEHKKLLESVGHWNVTTKRWDYPGADVIEGTAQSVVEPVLDGRFVFEKFTSTMDMGNGPMPFEGRSLFGYDNFQKKYVYTWADSMGTAIMTGSGNFDPTGKVLTMISENAPDMMTGKYTKMKSVSRDLGPDEHQFEMYSQNPDGSWWKTMEMIYRRAH